MNYKKVMPKYKIGDKVKIKSKQALLEYPMLIDPEKVMTKYEKSIMTIRAMCDVSSYYMIEDQADTDCNEEPGWIWDEKLIEGLAEQCHINIEYDDVINFFDN